MSSNNHKNQNIVNRENKGGYVPDKVYAGKRFIGDIISPNLISAIRLVLVHVFLIFFYLGNDKTSGGGFIITSAVIFALAAFTDFLDGYIARKYNKVTTVGKFLDPIADKILVCTALIVMLTSNDFLEGNIAGSYKWLPCIMGIFVALIVARELIISVFREIAADKKIVLAASLLGKAKTLTQDVAIFLLLISIALYEIGYYDAGFIFFTIGFVILCVAVLLTVASAVEYLVKNRKVFKE